MIVSGRLVVVGARFAEPRAVATANPRGLNGAGVVGLLALLGAGTAAATWELTGLRRRRRLGSL
jgi:hypothetical protein